ncbi:MAG: hypothetical protein AMXMBFR64_39900 [Myxococcales bacterium]
MTNVRGAVVTGALITLAAVAGCQGDDTPGLGPALLKGQLPGPRVVFDPLRRPDPEVPFPSDLATRIGPDGASSLNVSTEGATAYERRFRKHLNEIPGFSGMTPISVSFDAPIDLRTVTDKTVFVINVQPGSKRFGERLPLDLGRGWFPHDIIPTSYLPHDTYKDDTSMVLPPDNLADLDGDGVPETRVYHYENSTNTLDIRPLVPMEAGSRYAVVLTRGVKGWKDGNYTSIVSPFEAVNHDSQTESLRRALPSLDEVGVKPGHIAFAWTLTTGDLAKTFRTLRDGLYGRGTFAWLAEQFPPGIHDVYDLSVEFDGDDSHPNPDYKYPYVANDTRYVLQGAYLNSVMALIGAFQAGLGVDFDHVDYVVFGEMITPSFRATEDNVWDVDLAAGTGSVAPEAVPWMITVPKTTEHHKPPFPVVVHAHATATSRIEVLVLAGKLAQAGLATICIDAVGHGPILTEPKKMLLDALGGDASNPSTMSLVAGMARALLGPLLFTDWETKLPADMSLDDMLAVMLENGFMQQLALKGRAVDDDGDCNIRGGEAYYTPDPFRLRDAMRQTTLDYMVAVRMLHSLSQSAVPTPPKEPRKATPAELMPSLLSGDFNADGTLDVGGPDVPYFMSGVSLGGIHTALTAPLEEYIVAAAPVVAGAGIADIFVRTKLKDVVTPIMHLASGPLVVGCPQEDGTVAVSFNDDSDRCKITERTTWKGTDGTCLALPEVASIVHASLKVPAGGRVVVTHLPSGLSHEEVADATGAFAVPIEADIGDPLRIDVLSTSGAPVDGADLISPYQGVAKPRNTPDFRRLVQRVANVLEGSDAITVADRVLLDPLPGYPATNTLLLLAAGDRTVNFAAGLALARSMGLFGKDLVSPEASYRAWTEGAIKDRLLVDSDVSAPILDESHPEGGPGLCRKVETGTRGVSALCLADVKGHHEYIAQAKGSDAFPPLEGYKPTYTEYHANMIVSFFHSLGTRVEEDPCWADWKCATDKGLTAKWAEAVGAE